MEPGIDIRRRRDGSIDVEHYVRIARTERMAAARRAAWAMAAAPGRLLRWIGTIHLEVRNALLRSEKA